MGNCISRTNRGKLSKWTSTTLGCILVAFIILLIGAALVTMIWALIYGIIYLARGPEVHRRSDPTFWTSFGNNVQHNHVKRLPSFVQGSPTPTTRKIPEFTITQTPISSAAGAEPTTTSAVVDGQVVTYVYYSPRTWLTLAAVPHRSAVRQTRYSDTQRVVDYSIRSWTEHPYTPVQTVVSFLSTETLPGPVTIGADGSLGTATGTLENVAWNTRVGAIATTIRLPECKPENTRNGERQHGRQTTCTRPQHGYPTVGAVDSAKGSETAMAMESTLSTEAASDPALIWIPTGSLEQRDPKATKGLEAAIMTKDDDKITMVARAAETTMESALFWVPTSGLDARDAVATPTDSTSVAEASPDDKLFWIPPVDLAVDVVATPTESASATDAPPDDKLFWIPPAGFAAAPETAASTESTSATETSPDDKLFWIPPVDLALEAEAASTTQSTVATGPLDPALFWVPTSGFEVEKTEATDAVSTEGASDELFWIPPAVVA